MENVELMFKWAPYDILETTQGLMEEFDEQMLLPNTQKVGEKNEFFWKRSFFSKKAGFRKTKFYALQEPVSKSGS